MMKGGFFKTVGQLLSFNLFLAGGREALEISGSYLMIS